MWYRIQVTLEEMQQSDGAFAGSGSTSTAGSSVSENSRKRKLNDITTLSDDEEEDVNVGKEGKVQKKGSTSLGKRGSDRSESMLSTGSQNGAPKSKRRKVSGHINGTLQKERRPSAKTKQIEVIVLD